MAGVEAEARAVVDAPAPVPAPAPAPAPASARGTSSRGGYAAARVARPYSDRNRDGCVNSCKYSDVVPTCENPPFSTTCQKGKVCQNTNKTTLAPHAQHLCTHTIAKNSTGLQAFHSTSRAVVMRSAFFSDVSMLWYWAFVKPKPPPMASICHKHDPGW